MNNNLVITPETRIYDLLQNYPKLEDKLIEIAPTFKKLKNPVLRKTITKVTSLRQAAIVGNVKLDLLINELRKEIGQNTANYNISKDDDKLNDAPTWFDKSKITQCFDAVPIINNGGHPLDLVIKKVRDLNNDEIFELTTPFVPAPLIEKIEDLGFSSWNTAVKNDEFKTYFMRK